MTHETLYTAESPGDDAERDLRPQTIHEMIGQRKVCERLAIAVDAAKKREDPL